MSAVPGKLSLESMLKGATLHGKQILKRVTFFTLQRMPLQRAKLARKYISEMEAVRNILSFNEAASAAQLQMKIVLCTG